MNRPSHCTLFLLALVSAGLPVVHPARGEQPPAKFDGQQAFAYLQQICQLGPRYSGSPGMAQQQQLLTAHFTALGAKVSRQKLPPHRHPQTGKDTPMANLIVELHPEQTERILLCAHYDTRPLPDRDPNPEQRTNGTFLGANDGGSGTALLMEMARHLIDNPNSAADKKPILGVDLVFFDAEEFVWVDGRDKYFIGSEHFAREYRDNPPPHRYAFGVLVDMVGDAKLNILQERHSVGWAGTRPLVKEIWTTARKLRVREFVPRVMKFPVRDDHLPLNQIARIPVCNIIDFQYPNPQNSYWHTTSDIAANCSADSLGKVGWVLQEWLKQKRY